MTLPSPEHLRAAVARSAIIDLLAKIAWLSDHGDPEAYAACYAEDALWEISAAGLPVAATAIRGRGAILAGVIDRRASGVQGPGSATAHEVSMTHIEIDGDRAIARSLFSFYTGLDGIPELTAVGRYTDEFVEQADGSWLLRHRSITRE